MTYIRRALLTLVLSFGLAPAFAQVPAAVPALPDTERRTSYSITATTCACNVNFALYGDSTDYQNWVEVFINGVRYDYNDASHGWTITSPSGSLATLARPITNAVLTFNAVQTGTVQIVGARRPRRAAQFSENAGVSARNLNQVFTDIISQNREIWDKNNDMTGRGLFGLPGESISALPAAATRAGKFLGFDATGLIPQMTAAGPGTGNVVGPATSTVGDIALFNNTTGTLLSDAGGGAASHPIVHPSSGNLSGAGCLTAEAHSAWWVDQNLCSTSDVWQITSSDPSAGFTLTLTGSVTVGDAISLTITMGSGLCSGAGCTVTTGAATGGDTLTTLAGKLACAIANNANLVNLNGGSCAGGVVSPAASSTYGGYGSSNPIGYVVINGVGLAFDFNSNISLKVTSSVSGSATEVVTINNTTCGTRCSYALDNNPAIQMVRKSGAAPQPASVIAAIYAIGASSGCPTGACINYGNITNWVGNSTAASISSAWLMQTPDTTGALSGGWWFGRGLYANVGCTSPFGSTPTGCVTDKGTGTVNVPAIDSIAGSGYWLDGVNHIRRNRASGQFIFEATTTDSIVFSSSAGVGINVAPTGNAFVSSLGGFFSGTQVPTTGQGISLTGGATPTLSARDYGAASNLPLAFAASYLSNNEVAAPGSPAASNGRIWYDSTDHRLHDKNPSGTIGTTVVADTGTANNFLTAISAAGIISKAQPSAASLSNGTTGTAGSAVALANGPTFTAAITTPGATVTAQLTVLYAGANFTLQDSGTSFSYFQIQNNGGTNQMRVGAESAAGAALFAGSAGLAGVIGMTVNQPLQIFTNNTLRATIQASGGFSVGTGTDLGIGTVLANSTIKTLSTTAATSATTGSGIFGGGIGVSGDVWASGNHSVSTAAKTLLLKQGANGAVGTFVCNGATAVTVSNTNVATTDGIGISLNTVGGTVGAMPAIKTITGGTGFTVACTAADTSTMNYWIIKNAAWLLERDINPAANDNSPAFMEKTA